MIASLGVAMLVAKPLGISLATAAGLFAGSGTSTPTLQAALAAAGNQDPAIGYSVSYPFGVVGPIILMTIMAALLKPKYRPARAECPARELTLESACRGPDRRRSRRDIAGRRQDRRRAPGPHERAALAETRDCARATACCWSAARRASSRPRHRWARGAGPPQPRPGKLRRRAGVRFESRVRGQAASARSRCPISRS